MHWDDPNQILRIWPRRGLPALAIPHDLRRSCAQRLLDAGVSERDVQAILRHASFETTKRHYAPGFVQKSAASIREALAGDRVSVDGYKPAAESS